MKKASPTRAGGNKRGPGALRHLDWWRKSAEFREIARQEGQRAAARWKAAPRCGAKKRSDGEPCQNPGIEPSGRCRLHGGRSPRHDQWLRVQPRAGKSDPDGRRDRFKIEQKIKAAAARAKRLAAMAPEEREVHRRWHETHKPGPPGLRARLREERRQARLIAAFLAQQRPEANDPEAAELRRMIEELERQKQELELDMQVREIFG